MKLKKIIPQFVKNIYHLSIAVLANMVFRFPSKKLKVIGVTGTNGKTTTVQMITRILEKAGHKVAMASTINFKIGKKEWVNKTKFTTLSGYAVQKFISKAAKAGCEFLVLETSSHALDQHRVWGVGFDTAVMTNVTREHLDYHKTMSEYRSAKRKMFFGTENVVVNLDMENPEEYFCGRKNKYGYTLQSEISDDYIDDKRMTIIKGNDVVIGDEGSHFEVDGERYRINLPGKFNIENALAAICVGRIYNILPDKMKEALGGIKGVPGRMEYVPNERGISIIIDYAVTPDSLSKLYSLICDIRDSRKRNGYAAKIIAVFGSCGERDRGKRPIMGKIVSENADYVIITNEDPYNEDPMQIIKEVAEGVKDKIENENFWKIFDRREAIAKALRLAKSGDIIVVTGKGAEEVMAVGSQRIPWNDRKVILEELGTL